MAIYDRNGNVYKLRGPNPIMQTQREWDRSKLQLINLGGKTHEMVVEAESEHVAVIKKETPKPRAKTVDAHKFIEEIRAIPAEPVAPQIPPKPRLDDTVAKILKERGATFYCAPAVSRTVKDDFYGNSHGVLEYGEKYLFQGIPIDESDFELQFWSLDPVTVGSIVYRKDRGERWWKVREVMDQSGGWISNCLPSEVNPDFS
jgi:hypothetical protein